MVSSVAILMLQAQDGKIVSANQAALDFLGRPASQVTGKNTLELQLWAHPMARSLLMHALAERGHFENRHEVFLRGNGEMRDVLLSVSALRLHGVDYFQAVFQDVSDRLRQARALRTSAGEHCGPADQDERKKQVQQAAHLSLANQAAGIGIFEIFTNGAVAWDPQTYRLYGRDPGTWVLPAEIFRESLAPAEYERVAGNVDDMFKHKLQTPVSFDIRWPNGEMRRLTGRSLSLVDSHGKTMSILGVNWDITEQHKTHMALLESQQSLSLLTQQLLDQERASTQNMAALLHDQLGQTLTALRLCVDLEKARVAHEPRQHPNLLRLDLLVGQASDDVRSLLIGLRPPLLKEQGLGAALDNEIQRSLICGEHVDLVFEADDRVMQERWPPEVEYAFFMIAREAIANAVAHANASLIEVILVRHKGGIRLDVIDNGEGFKPTAFQIRPGHLGLVGMRERAQGIGAELVFSGHTGEGARVSLTWTGCQ